MGAWIQVLVDEAERRWRDSGRPLFLAQIPPLLRSRDINLTAALVGRPLLRAIEIDAAGKLRLVNDPNHPPAWAVIPNSAPADLEVSALFVKSPTSKGAPQLTLRPPRFRRWFWAAFIKSLAPESRRWVLSAQFIDLPASDRPTESGAVEVLNMEIVPTERDALADEAKVAESIQKWSVRTKSNLDQFRDGPNDSGEKPMRHHRVALAFDSLDPEDQKRIVIPLDIVMKLLRR